MSLEEMTKPNYRIHNTHSLHSVSIDQALMFQWYFKLNTNRGHLMQEMRFIFLTSHLLYNITFIQNFLKYIVWKSYGTIN